MEKKKNNLGVTIFKVIFIILFVVFITLYFSQTTGYYEYSQYQKVNFTNEQIKKFEDDVKSGKNIDLNDYLDNKAKDYSNSVSNLGNNVSNGISNTVKNLILDLFKRVNKMIE